MDKSVSNRLFVITNTTHLQVIKNYIKTYPKGENFVLLTITPFKNFEKFIEEITNTKFLNPIGTILNNQNTKFPKTYFNLTSNSLKIRNLKLSQYNFHQVIFSNYDSWLQHLILKQSGILKPILISDGVAIFDNVQLRKKTTKAPLNCNQFISDKIFKIIPYKSIHFYSPLDLNTSIYDTLEVFKFKKRSNYEINSNLIYLVDSHLVELNFIGLENKINILKKLKLDFPEKEIVYYAHRRESYENLEKYQFLGEVRRDTIPFEERLSKDNNLPFMIISFVSSILINLPVIYPNITFRYIKFDNKDIIDDKFRIEYAELIKNFNLIKSENFYQLDLDS